MKRRRVLIVSPHVPPANGADSHRARMLSPFLRDNGWDAEILAVQPEQLAVPLDPWLMLGMPSEVPIQYCNAWSLRWSKVPGLGTLDFRAMGPMRRLGTALLNQRHFDLVYFSTTVFSLTKLGVYWKKRFRIPFIVDYQDPWVTDYYRTHRDVTPPGGRLKYSVVDSLARRTEPSVIGAASGITTVSDAYIDQLNHRYSIASRLPHLTIPFPGAQRDFDRVRSEAVHQHSFSAGDGLIHWVYVGVSGPIMSLTLQSLFEAFAAERLVNPEQTNRVRMHFIGTSYAPAGRGIPFVQPLAERMGVGDLVQEQTNRIPYSEALACMNDADAILAIGSNDASYNASKLLPFLMARKPCLAVFHEQSPAASLLHELGGCTLTCFDDVDSSTTLSARIREKWFQSIARRTIVPLNEPKVARYTDQGQAKILCQFFAQTLNNTQRGR